MYFAMKRTPFWRKYSVRKIGMRSCFLDISNPPVSTSEHDLEVETEEVSGES